MAFTFAKAELVSRNYEVVGREVTQPIYEEVEQDLGGAFDSVTGEYDKVKSEEIYLTTLRLLKDRLGVDMVLYHYIDEFQVNFTGDIVNWHGQSENVWMQEREFLERFAEALFIQRTGTVGALSYCFTLNSMLDEALYSSCGGLQLLAKMKYIKPEGVKEKRELLTSLIRKWLNRQKMFSLSLKA
ncbi:hypothetical protein [Shewanella woodyi]|uniref:hypothetical protein n=1 Tax=Shewanella woodyi TaxID=60961 RepID=UPI0037493785